MSGVTCPKCGNYTTPPTVWHGVVPPPMCTCAAFERFCPHCGKAR